MMVCEEHRQTEGTKVYPGQRCPWCERDALFLQVDGLQKALAHWKDCHGTTADKLKESHRLNDEMIRAMNDLYSLLSLIRHRHLPKGLDLEKDIDKSLGAAATLLEPWWKQQLHKTEKR